MYKKCISIGKVGISIGNGGISIGNGGISIVITNTTIDIYKKFNIIN